MPNFGAFSTSMRRSNSSGCPVSSACTGASKPRPAALFGTSCTWPSVIMMTPASRSGGVLASARLRSAKRLVPAAAFAGRLGCVDPLHLQAGNARELAFQVGSDGGGLLRAVRRSSGWCSRRSRRWRYWRGSRAPPAAASGWRAPRAAPPAPRARSSAPRVRRTSRATTRKTASTTAAPEQGAGKHRREIDRPAHARSFYCPSRSSSAGTCTWSAL